MQIADAYLLLTAWYKISQRLLIIMIGFDDLQAYFLVTFDLRPTSFPILLSSILRLCISPQNSLLLHTQSSV